MAKQVGIFQTRGTVGNVTFRKTEEGYLLGMKSSLDKTKMEGNPRFDATREINKDFTAASKGAKLIFDAMTPALKRVAAPKTFSRLQRLARMVVNSDTVHKRGQRTMSDGNIGLLLNFDFSHKAQLSDLLRVPVSTTIDRVSGEFEVEVPAFKPEGSLKFPNEATHYQITACASTVDFVTNTMQNRYQASAMLPVDTETTTALLLEGALEAASTDPIIIGVGIQFFKQENAFYNPFIAESLNGFKLIAVDF